LDSEEVNMQPMQLIGLRRTAEKAVSDMPEGELKVKAFEVILNNLLRGHKHGGGGEDDTATAHTRPKQHRRNRRTAAPTSRPDRVLQLKDEGYFRGERSISDVRQELGVHGWHYPLTALSGTLQTLVQRRELRRQKVRHGTKEIWRYSNA
jgi:hypothetical protein